MQYNTVILLFSIIISNVYINDIIYYSIIIINDINIIIINDNVSMSMILLQCVY